MGTFEKHLNEFISYLKVEKNASPLTIESYQRDIRMFFTFLKKELIQQLKDVDYSHIRIFLVDLYEQELSRRSVARTISCLRTFYTFLERESKAIKNPFIYVNLPKQKQLIPTFFYEDEMEQLF